MKLFETTFNHDYLMFLLGWTHPWEGILSDVYIGFGAKPIENVALIHKNVVSLKTF